MIFGKKHHDPTPDSNKADQATPVENDYVIVERRHSTQPTGYMYPNLDPSLPVASALPYAVSPSLPNLAPPMTYNENQKQGSNTVPDNKDMLSGVPFILSSHFDSHNVGSDFQLNMLLRKRNEVSENTVSDFFDYNFSLENQLLKEMESYKP